VPLASNVADPLIVTMRDINEAVMSGTRRTGAASNASRDAHVNIYIKFSRIDLFFLTTTLTLSKKPVESRASRHVRKPSR